MTTDLLSSLFLKFVPINILRHLQSLKFGRNLQDCKSLFSSTAFYGLQLPIRSDMYAPINIIPTSQNGIVYSNRNNLHFRLRINMTAMQRQTYIQHYLTYRKYICYTPMFKRIKIHKVAIEIKYKAKSDEYPPFSTVTVTNADTSKCTSTIQTR